MVRQIDMIKIFQASSLNLISSPSIVITFSCRIFHEVGLGVTALVAVPKVTSSKFGNSKIFTVIDVIGLSVLGCITNSTF